MSNAEGAKLTIVEQAKLQNACQAIRDNIDTAKRAGEIVARSLRMIRDEHLYREIYLSFEEFCHAEFGITRQRAYQLIEFSKVLDDVNQVDTDVEITERQARELAKLETAGERQEAWEEAKQESDGKPTANQVKRAVEKRTGKGSGNTAAANAAKAIEVAKAKLAEIDTDETSRPQGDTSFEPPTPKESSLEVNTLKELIENEKEKLTVFRWLWDSMLPWQRAKLPELIELWSQ